MIVLALETATELVGAAVADESGVRACAWAAGRRRHAEALAPSVAHVCEQAGIALNEVTVVAVDVGPGLFTGLRVGVATAKGLAEGLGVGVVAATSLELLAVGALDAGVAGPVLAVVDARRAEVFAARYEASGGPVPLELDPPRLWAPDALAAALDPGPEGLIAVGDGAHRYAGLLGAVAGVTVAGPAARAPAPDALARLALARLGSGGAAVPPAEVEPLYLRDADARSNWVQRSRR